MSEFLFQAPSSVRLIPAGHQGKLTAPGHETMPVRVFERGSDVLMLVVLLDADDRRRAERTSRCCSNTAPARVWCACTGEARLEQR